MSTAPYLESPNLTQAFEQMMPLYFFYLYFDVDDDYHYDYYDDGDHYGNHVGTDSDNTVHTDITSHYELASISNKRNRVSLQNCKNDQGRYSS